MQYQAGHMLKVEGSIRDYMQVVNSLLRKGVGLYFLRQPIENLMFVLCGSPERYEFSERGFNKLRIEWDSYYNEFFGIVDYREMEKFKDGLYGLLIDCFPEELDEEVYGEL